MNKLADILSGIWLFYYNGFKQMTWGRTLWLDYCAQIVCNICGTALLFFPSGYARTQQ